MKKDTFFQLHFLAFAANEGLDKQRVIEMINSHYDQFTGDDDSSLFKRL